ncbi:GumC family protein [Botryobacter ruber]|uniref:GumC family protein n=1 Tax=Botryobacter ruber TaxID=2171629 RepID=UPI000E0A4196|nr:tyrosine-protein kinase [Botryobacter ruber]
MTEKDFFQFQAEESEQIDLKAVLIKYLRFWYLFLIGVVLALGVAFLYLRYYAVPQYDIYSKILIRDDKKGTDLLAGSAFSDLEIFNSSKNVDNEIEVLNAVSLMQRVLNELDLHVTYYKKGRVHDVEIYGDQLPLKVIVKQLENAALGKSIVLHIKDNNSFVLEEQKDKEVERSVHKFGQEIKKPYGVFTVVAASGSLADYDAQRVVVEFNDLEQLANDYTYKLEIAPANKNSSVLYLNLKDPVPQKGMDIINKLVEVYNQEAVEDKNVTASSTINFIDERLQFLTEELSSVEKGVEEFKRANELTDVSSDAQVYVQRASEYNKQLAEYEIQLDVLNSIEKYLKDAGQKYQLVPSSLSIQDPTLLGLISKFNELQLERERMLRTTQASNMLVRNINDQLANLKVNIIENLQNIRKGLVITRNNLKASTARFETKIQMVPAIERELLEIQRQQGIKQGLYLYLLQKREEAGVALAAAVANCRVLDPAMAEGPVEPKLIMVYILAILLGVGVPFAGIYTRDLLDDKVQVLKDVEQATNTPVLGEISHIKTKESLIVNKSRRDPVVELFNMIRANLQFATVGKENKVIMVSSSMGGEGKTFFSINLAASMVVTGKRAIVVDLDLRKPMIMANLNLPNDVGVTSYIISDKVSVADMITPVEAVPGIFALGSGPIPPNPVELLSSAKVGLLLDELKEIFDYVIIDTPPVGLVADAFALAPYTDSSIYLVRYSYTYKSQLRIVEDIYKNKKLQSPVIVLNDAKKRNGYGYGYGYQNYSNDKKSIKVSV